MPSAISLTALHSEGLGEDFALMRTMEEPSHVPRTLSELHHKVHQLDHYIKVGYVADKEPEFNLVCRGNFYSIHFINEIERLKFVKSMYSKMLSLAKVLGLTYEDMNEWEIPF